MDDYVGSGMDVPSSNFDRIRCVHTLVNDVGKV